MGEPVRIKVTQTGDSSVWKYMREDVEEALKEDTLADMLGAQAFMLAGAYDFEILDDIGVTIIGGRANG